ncbi:5'-3' exonuclease [Candidatus Tachikawaea gelatinosa]|uniref:DNA polymerase I n=1 Tax=Candidatus Tachikawaea gelatinosa TaxID=1410383 RepID=A0A090BWA9_9ENTR|nr:5'-3' exonuclease H3TH domain-containing protein [Candidatus Tachikawaea gelatinosa]BAP58286.1 DNA polymerase I [Candidatus Tachikawaea gelatinosa]
MKKKNDNIFLLIDGSFHLYRAYYSYPFMVNTEKKPIGAIYGFIYVLNFLIKKYQPINVAVVFDHKGKTFRNELYEKYKSHRLPMPNELSIQIKPLHDIIQAMGIPIISIPGVEADDVIGTIAKLAEFQKKPVLISTADKDMTQLVSNKINIFNIINKELIGPKEVEKKYGITPNFIVDYFALIGDISDNIPGVPGIGKQRAKDLIQKFGNIESIYDSIEKFDIYNKNCSNFVFKQLKNHKKIAFLSYQLAKIKTNVVIKDKYNNFFIRKCDKKRLFFLLKELNFKKNVINFLS